ncbi:TPA: hypothetical protein N0F65_003657 [Lagenidium giganteum]|uniref:PPM-type phosphatase domain-containing protein n=1 Tax=Lagenidium giganteum TaxID=4803 RepID=A0AAV2YEG0_9STRA|nr:TPA: hypothetical protein N0F65_003657 [Lagenidium giganteum]
MAASVSVREEVEIFLHEHRFLVTKLLESLSSAALPPSTITPARLRTVNETFAKVLEKDRDLLTAVKKLARHQVAQKELLRIQDEINKKKEKVVRYAAQLRRSQQDIAQVLKKHEFVLNNARSKSKVVLDPREVVAYAHKIAGTTSAPKEWRPGFPMFGFMPPAPQEHMMRAGVLSRGIVDEIVTKEPETYTAMAKRSNEQQDVEGVPIGLGASDAEIRKQMPPGWNPGDPVDLPLDALLHYMGRGFFAEHGVTLPETWKAGDPIPPEAMEILRKKLKLPEKRAALYDDEVVDDLEAVKKKRKLEEGGVGSDKEGVDDSDSDSDSSESDSDKDTRQKISLSLSSDDDSDSDSDSAPPPSPPSSFPSLPHITMALRQNVARNGSVVKLRQQEATAANVSSPKGISKKTPGVPGVSPAKAGINDHTLGLQRRRLSVVSDNKLVEGMAQVTTNDVEYVEDGTNAVAAYAGLSKKGYAPYNPRKKNQDSMIIKHDSETKSLLLCVFDGHGEAGDGVSNSIRDRFPTELFKHPKFAASGDLNIDAANIRVAITDALNTVEKHVLRDSSIDTEFSGTTAVVSVIRESLLVVGNVGDSRITRGFVTGNADGTTSIACEPVSIDHKPDRPDEKSRILASGGRVFAVEYDDGIDGPPRVWLGHMDVPGLAMSRSLGDAVAHTAGVTSEPEFFTRMLDESDRCLVVATDGLWEFMSNEEVVDIIMGQKDPKVAVDLLIMEANRRWMKEEQVIDDTTVIVAYVNISDMVPSPTSVAATPSIAG